MTVAMAGETFVDHLVVAAATLEQGVAWCQVTLGVTPGPGGRHPLMGTHNRLFKIASAAFPDAYFEIIAIDPDAPPPGRARWFGLDEAALQARIAEQPRLVHVVARCSALQAQRQTLIDAGCAPGEVLSAGRGHVGDVAGAAGVLARVGNRQHSTGLGGQRARVTRLAATQRIEDGPVEHHADLVDGQHGGRARRQGGVFAEQFFGHRFRTPG